MNSLVTDLIEATSRGLAKARVQSVDDVRACPMRLVKLGPRLAGETKRLKEILYDSLYSHQNVLGDRKVIIRCVERLFRYYVGHPRSLPPFYFAKTQHEPAHRVVCDYIAGMTDNYLVERYRKLLGE
jgi:dGTPase